MKKLLIFTIAVFLTAVLTISIVKTARAWYAIATCSAVSDLHIAWGMAGSFGLVYGSVGAIASVGGLIESDTASFFTDPISVHADDYGSPNQSGYANAHALGYDELTGEYAQMTDSAGIAAQQEDDEDNG